MNKYLFFSKVVIVADTEDEARAILINDPTPIAENAVLTNEKYTEKKVKGYTNR